MHQIIFNSVSSAEMSELPKPLQLEILSEFHALSPEFMDEHPEKFGKVQRGKRTLHRFRAKDYRIYFEKNDKGLLIHRVLNKNTLTDFLYRSHLDRNIEDQKLAENPKFWEMIDAPSQQEKEKAD